MSQAVESWVSSAPLVAGSGFVSATSARMGTSGASLVARFEGGVSWFDWHWTSVQLVMSGPSTSVVASQSNDRSLWQTAMLSGRSDSQGHVASPNRRSEELFAFLILAIFIWPILAVGVVGGYGFIVWMLQIVFGPPGPPH